MNTKVNRTELNNYSSIENYFMQQAHTEKSNVLKKRKRPGNQYVSCDSIKRVSPKSYEVNSSLTKSSIEYRISQQKNMAHKKTLTSSVLKVLTWVNLGMAYLLGLAPRFSHAFSVCPNGYAVKYENPNYRVSIPLPIIPNDVQAQYPMNFCEENIVKFTHDRYFLDNALHVCTKLTDNSARNQLPTGSFGRCEDVRFVQCQNLLSSVTLYYSMRNYFCVPERRR